MEHFYSHVKSPAAVFKDHLVSKSLVNFHHACSTRDTFDPPQIAHSSARHAHLLFFISRLLDMDVFLITQVQWAVQALYWLISNPEYS